MLGQDIAIRGSQVGQRVAWFHKFLVWPAVPSYHRIVVVSRGERRVEALVHQVGCVLVAVVSVGRHHDRNYCKKRKCLHMFDSTGASTLR